jgi:hypothetical protein
MKFRILMLDNKNYPHELQYIDLHQLKFINIPWEIVPMEQVHNIYSLRWQIEVVFKTWRSLFVSIIVTILNESV